jgi:hypothetical protein
MELGQIEGGIGDFIIPEPKPRRDPFALPVELTQPKKQLWIADGGGKAWLEILEKGFGEFTSMVEIFPGVHIGYFIDLNTGIISLAIEAPKGTEL